MIWKRSGFDAALKRLGADGRIAILSHEEAGHFSRVKDQKVQVIAARVQ